MLDFFPVNHIVKEYLYKKEHYASESIPLEKADEEINPADIYNIDWMKFAFDGSHTSLFIDLAPIECTFYTRIEPICIVENHFE